MIHSPVGLVHTVAAFVALLAGTVVFLRPKGGAAHRRLGYVYVASMVVVVVTSFMIYRLTGRMNFLHAAAAVSAITIGLGLSHAITRRPAVQWYGLHYRWMSWSFIGLVAALVAEMATRVGMPLVLTHLGRSWLTGFWIIFGITSATVVCLGYYLTQKHAPRA